MVAAPADMTDMIALAARLADAAGAICRQYYRSPLSIDDKADASPVTIADREAERTMRAILAGAVPQHGIIGEEMGAERADAEYVWVLDPIDGTKSFMTGRPLFVTLIALLRRGEPILGVIDQPIVGDRWIGAEDLPTMLNGRPARVRSCPRLDGAVVATTTPEMFVGPERQAAFARLRGGCKIGLFGGDGYSYGQLSSGHLDIVVEDSMKLHDFAALVPVVNGAGGIITDWAGRPLGAHSAGDILAAGDRAAHRAAVALLAPQ
ncbi:MAG TPA: histidinol-phosphatase [Alphaproteobacteria bacterium]|nr:histidinol-phosphatase [Alphaproteobacteria bacterium]